MKNAMKAGGWAETNSSMCCELIPLQKRMRSNDNGQWCRLSDGEI